MIKRPFGCTIFIGLPESNWTTSSKVCLLPKIENINTTDISFRSSENLLFKHNGKAWTGTVIRYTKFAAFIGCGRKYSPIDSGRNVKSVKDCLRHCSDYSSASYFVMKSSRCYCLSGVPDISDDINDCRAECTNTIDTPCGSGRSALVFTFVKDISITIENTYIEQECVTTNKEEHMFTIRDCNAKYLYGCKNTSSFVFSRISWYDYQERCLKDGSFVLYNRNTTGKDAKEKKVFWTPIFRSHTVVSGKYSGKYLCVAIQKADTNTFTVEECSTKFPFLCSESKKKKTIDDITPNVQFPQIITLPTFVVVADLLVILILIILIVIICIKSSRGMRMYEENLKRLNERLPGTEFSNYTGIDKTSEEIDGSAYNELSDISPQLTIKHHKKI
ncbi:unnamed protein product [Mytilus edulis]|uniref:WSC domain-containing protein n=1 Tax=Mytilus edulis TaxID=6550 RepID=A0A8S3T544_MYTED|nr:unnamed protein product [Mytilus edulis]